MNITDFLIRQKKLDDHFLAKSGHPKDTDLLSKQMLAANVEFNEMLNEWGGFKHWKSSHVMDEQKLKEEAADVMCFLFSVASLPMDQDEMEKQEHRALLQELFNTATGGAVEQMSDDILTDTHNMNVLFVEMSMAFNPSVETAMLGAGEQEQAMRHELFQQVFVTMAYFFQYLRHHFAFTDEIIEEAYDQAVSKNEGRIASNY